MARLLTGSSWSCALFLLALAPTVPAQIGVGQGNLIGDGNVPNGDWPLLATSIQNTFEASATNPYWPAAGSFTDRRRRLGKLLFWDEQVSSDNTMACGTCHFPSAGGSDPRPLFQSGNPDKNGSLGMVPQDLNGDYITDTNLQQERRVTRRNPPSMIGAAFFSHLFWTGKAGPTFVDLSGNTVASPNSALESLSVDPPVSPIEMAHDGLVWGAGEIEGKIGGSMPLALATPSTIPPDLTTDLNTDYATLFDLAFGNDPNPDLPALVKNASGVSRERFAFALATYMRTLVPDQAPVDVGPLSASETNGFNIMLGAGGGVGGGGNLQGGCFNCHSHDVVSGNPSLAAGGGFKDAFDNLLSDGERHNAINVPSASGVGGSNLGVRTPSLRNVALKNAFFHNGSVTSLDDLVDFYNRQFVDQNNNVVEPVIPFKNNGFITEAEEDDVKAFLHALTDPRVAGELPPFDRPDLHSERVPFASNEYGTGTQNASGPVPEILANVPYLADDLTFKVGVFDAAPGAMGAVGFSLATAPGPVAWIDLGSPHFLGWFAETMNTDGIGTYHFPQQPVLPGAVGTRFYAQWFFTQGDALTAASNAASLSVQ